MLSDDLWLSETFTRGQARVDLYGLARHTPGHVRLKGVRIDLQRGELAWSEQALAERWGWSRGKVRRFLAELAAERVLVQRPSNITSVITMLSYDCQPAASTADDASIRAANGTASSTADGTRKKKEKNQQGRKESSPEKRFVPPTVDEVREYCLQRGNAIDPQRFVDFNQARDWKSGRTPIKDWKAAIRAWESHQFSSRSSSMTADPRGTLAAWNAYHGTDAL